MRKIGKAEICILSCSNPYRKPKLFEDYYSRGRRKAVFAVADGITQLSYSAEEKRTGKTEAKKVAEIFCKNSVGVLDKWVGSRLGERLIIKAIENANRNIAAFNRKLGVKPDFWKTDYACCTGAICFIEDWKLFWGTVGDCFVGVLRKGNWKLRPEDAYENVHEFWKYIEGEENKEFVTRALLRNKRGIFWNGKNIGYGALTGEKAALDFLHSGAVKISRGDIVFIGTDGTLPYMESKEFLRLFVKNHKETNKYFKLGKGKERTLISIRIL